MPDPRVLMVVSNGFTHDPRVAAEAASLTQAGYEVTVLAWDRDGTLPVEEMRDRVRVVRVRNTLGMRLNPYELFWLRAFWRVATRRALELHREKPFHVVHCHDLDTLPVGVALRRRPGVSLVYDAHEFFPYIVGELSRAKPWEGRFARLERRLAPHAALILVASPPQQEYFAAMTRGPIVTVMNTRALAYRDYEPPRNPRMRVVYIGSLQMDRLLVPFAELAVGDDSFEAEIGGWGPAAAPIRELAAKSRGNLRFLGVVSMEDVVPRTHAADVVYSLLDPSKRLFRLAAPNKFFEALVAGRPVLVTRGTWVGSEVEAAECGLAIEYSKASLRDALRTLQKDASLRERLGRNAFRLAGERYNWAHEERTLLGAYRQLGVPRGTGAG